MGFQVIYLGGAHFLVHGVLDDELPDGGRQEADNGGSS